MGVVFLSAVKQKPAVCYTFTVSNFSIFDIAQLELLLEPFAPGMVKHITPIKYEALTPDSFVFLFRTTGVDNTDHFFVSLETDSQNSLEGVRCTIEEWHGTDVIDFWPLHDTDAQDSSDGISSYSAATSGPYFAFLAEVRRPTHKGYWSEAVFIMPGDVIGDKIQAFPEETQAKIRQALASVLQHKINANLSFLESLQAKKQGIMADDINRTNISVAVYVQPNGDVELFHKSMG